MLTVYTDWISGDNQYRMRYGKQYTGGDGVDDLSYKPSTAGVPTGSSGSQHLPYIAVEIEYDNPTRSFARFGDSNTEGYGWFDSQTNNLSTPTKPITCANFGMSSNRSIQYFTVADAVIKKGMAFTDWVIPSHSHNDSNGTDFDLDQTKVQILKVLDEADSLGVQVWIWTHWLGTTTGSPASDPEIETYLTWIRSICAQGRANLVDIAANWISATYSSDGNVHPNAAGIAYNKTVVNSALRRYL
jgi:lysophospholipase L1-like esterase